MRTVVYSGLGYGFPSQSFVQISVAWSFAMLDTRHHIMMLHAWYICVDLVEYEYYVE